MPNQLPTPVRNRRTEGSKRLSEYAERNGVRPVSWYVPEALHGPLVKIAAERGFAVQSLVTHACEVHYGAEEKALPPLVPPTHVKTDPHKNFTWYAPVALHKAIKLLALELECTAQQLITSAVVHQYKDVPEIKELRIVTGSAPYARAPQRGVIQFQRAPRASK